MFNSQNIADTYDQIGLNFSATRQKLSPEVISLIPKIPKGGSVLDLGCGNGILINGLPENTSYTGIDISKTLINIAKQARPNSIFILGDVLDPSLWKTLGQFDLIAAIGLLHHLPDTKDHEFVLKQIKKHLKPAESAGKPGGSVFLSNWRLLQPKFDEFRTDPKHLSIPFHGGLNRDFYAFTDSEIKDLIKKLGFSQAKTIIAKDNLYLIAKC